MSSPEQVGGYDRVVEPVEPALPRKPPIRRRRRLGVAAAVPPTRPQCASGPAPMDMGSAIEVESPVTFWKPSPPAHRQPQPSNPESTALRGAPSGSAAVAGSSRRSMHRRPARPPVRSITTPRRRVVDRLTIGAAIAARVDQRRRLASPPRARRRQIDESGSSAPSRRNSQVGSHPRPGREGATR